MDRRTISIQMVQAGVIQIYKIAYYTIKNLSLLSVKLNYTAYFLGMSLHSFVYIR